MSVQESVILKHINNSISYSYRRLSAESRFRCGTRSFRDWIRNAVNIQRVHSTMHYQNSNTHLIVANREVHLEGYKSHEDVIRAYLEFSGIDPDSKEGRFYFEL